MEATIATIVATAAPLVYATVGETIAEKAGVINLSLDGSILLSAMTGFATTYVTGSVMLGFLAAMLVSMVIAALIAFASIELKLNQIAIGFVLTLLAAELSSFLGRPYVGVRGTSVPHWRVPLLSDIPFLGKVLFDHNLSVYGSFLALIAAYVFIFRTKRGLELQGIGERPEAAFARGIPVNRMRYLYTVIGGALVGIAGAAYSLDVKFGWRENLTLNFGWIALAIVIFGGWHPVRAAFGCYLFGALQVLALKLQPVSAFQGVSQILPILPFVLMIFTLVIVYLDWFRRFGERHPRWRRLLSSEPPAGIGRVFERE
ncbi:MAG: ABC transporter permease [Actinomycetota bacterium]|jgi:simple sugar transport system permease protein|nr:ABC transporter permease [Actinomycetota bacterium]